jgi:hypothetical protein
MYGSITVKRHHGELGLGAPPLWDARLEPVAFKRSASDRHGIELAERNGFRKALQRHDGRYRVRTSDLLLVRDAQEGEGKTRAATSDADFGCNRDSFVEWLSAGGDVPWTD